VFVTFTRVLVVVQPEICGVKVALAHPVAGVAAHNAFDVKREPARREVIGDRLRVVLVVLDGRLRRHGTFAWFDRDGRPEPPRSAGGIVDPVDLHIGHPDAASPSVCTILAASAAPNSNAR
jgi:hypothetical protein